MLADNPTPAKSHERVKMSQIPEHHTIFVSMAVETNGFMMKLTEKPLEVTEK